MNETQSATDGKESELELALAREREKARVEKERELELVLAREREKAKAEKERELALALARERERALAMSGGIAERAYRDAADTIALIRSYAAELKTLTERSEGETDAARYDAEPKAEPAAADLPALIGEIDDIAFRAHLLSLNIEIAKTNADDSLSSVAPFIDEIRNIENKSVSVAGRAGDVFSSHKGGEDELSRDDTDHDARLREMARLADEIQQAAAKLGAVEVPNERLVVSPIASGAGEGLY
jgi:hypothetical protein